MLRALIVDDEAPARRRLRKLLSDLAAAGRLEIVGEASDGVDTLEQLQENGVDLLFLDIQMPEMNGFDVLERLSPEERPAVIFTTAYDAYAVRAFEANAVDYLLKPISRERLKEAVGRAERFRRSPEGRQISDARLAKLLDWMDAQAEAKEAPTRREGEFLRQISVPHRDRILIFPVSQLISAEINEGITRMYTLEEAPGGKERLRQHIVSYTLDQLESHLDPDRFMRVHRSALISLDHIQEMIPWFSGRYKLILTGDHEVIASRERSKLLKDRLML